ncbi:hypothetical protein IPL68_03145 [Candidatus Saccharibacteria bacterium]|nr:MAG: hypothetical protein IPL68_03145 [Candidatus Saccharibacteria bacterium]
MSEVNMSSNEGSPKNRIGVEISVVTSQDEEGKPLRVVTWFKPAEHTEWPYTVERDHVQEHFRVEDTNGTAYVYPGRVYLGDEDHVGVPDKYGETYYRLLAELGEHVSPIKEGSNLFKWEDASATAPPPSNIAA